MPEGQHIMGTGRKRERNWQEELVRRGEREEKVSWKREKKRVGIRVTLWLCLCWLFFFVPSALLWEEIAKKWMDIRDEK